MSNMFRSSQATSLDLEVALIPQNLTNIKVICFT